MKRIILAAFFMIIQNAGYAQTIQEWVKIFGNGNGFDICYSIANTNDDAYIAVGTIYIENLHCFNYFLVKLDTSGNQIWQKTSNSLIDDEARAVIVNSSNEFIIMGNREGHPLLLKTDASGDTIWIKHIIINDTLVGQMRAMKSIADSGYILAGVSGGPMSENKLWVIRTDNDGNTVWSNIYDYGFGNSLTVTDQNDIVVAGLGSVVKLKSNGDMIWVKYYGGVYSCNINSVKETNDGGLILIGSAWTSGYGDLCLIKTDNSGNKIWEKMYGSSWGEIGYDVIQTSDNGFLVIGQAPDPFSGGSFKLWLLRTNENGDTLWTQKYIANNDPLADVYPESCILDQDSKIIIAGSFSTSHRVGFISKYSIIATNITDYPQTITDNFKLFQNYPNPFNSTTEIRYSLPKDGMVKLNVYNTLGQKVAELVNGEIKAGSYEVNFNANNLSSGIYYYRIEVIGFVNTKKMILLK